VRWTAHAACMCQEQLQHNFSRNALRGKADVRYTCFIYRDYTLYHTRNEESIMRVHIFWGMTPCQVVYIVTYVSAELAPSISRV